MLLLLLLLLLLLFIVPPPVTLLFPLLAVIGDIKCADCDEGTLIELFDIILVGLIRTADGFVGLYEISSSEWSMIAK